MALKKSSDAPAPDGGAHPLDYLRRLLRARIDLLEVHENTYAARATTALRVVPTARLLLAWAGRARYRIEEAELDLRAGDMLWVPAGTRRGWEVPPGGSLGLSWATFDSPAPEPWSGEQGAYLLRTGVEVKLERAALARLLQWHGAQGEPPSLRAEGELKAILARFLSQVEDPRAAASHPDAATSRGAAAGPRAVDRAVEWLGRNFKKPDALEGLAARVELSPNHFRLLFKQRMGLSPRAYLTALRMRAARAYLQETDWPVKAVARQAGYTDALYFSRQYRRFWKRPPTEDRAFRP